MSEPSPPPSYEPATAPPPAFAPTPMPFHAAPPPPYTVPAPPSATTGAAYGAPAPAFGAPPMWTVAPAGFAPAATPYATNPAGGWPPNNYAPAPGWPPFPGPIGVQKVGVRKTTIVLVSILGVLVVGLGAIGAIAKMQQAPAKRTLTIPQTLLGLPPVHTPELDALAQDVTTKLQSSAVVANADVGYFGSDGETATLYAGYAKLKRRPNSSEKAALSGSQQVSAGGQLIGLSPVAAGPFGGQMLCGDLTDTQRPVRLCASIDDGAVVYTGVLLTDTTDADADLIARQIISAVEK